jgi:hypothetical protein
MVMKYFVRATRLRVYEAVRQQPDWQPDCELEEYIFDDFAQKDEYKALLETRAAPTFI